MPGASPGPASVRTSSAPSGGATSGWCSAICSGGERQEVAPRHPQQEAVEVGLGHRRAGARGGRPPARPGARRSPRPTSPRSSTRWTFATSSRTSVARHGVHAAGPSRPRRPIASRYSAARRSGSPTRGGDVEHQVVVLEVAPRRGVGQQEVLGDHELRELARRARQAHRARALGRRPRGRRRRGSPSPVLPMSWSSAPEQQRRRGPRPARRPRPRRWSSPRVVEQPGDVRERAQQVHVDGEPVVRIALRPAADERSTRAGSAPSRSDAVERLEHRRPRRRPRRSRSRNASRTLVGPLDRVGDLGTASIASSGLGRQRRRARARPRASARSTPSGVGSSAGAARAAAQVAVEHRRADVLDLARVLEHLAHQPVDRAQAGLVGEPHPPRDPRLLLEEQAVRRAAGLQVQRAPHAQEELLGVVDGLALRGAQQPDAVERRRVGRLAERDPEPAERVDVAQAARALLQVGLEQVGDASRSARARDSASSRRRSANARGLVADARATSVPRVSAHRPSSPASHRPSSIAVAASSRSAASVDALGRRPHAVADA